MSVRFRFNEHVIVLEDVRELLFLILHVQLAGPDPLGNLTQVKARLDRFVEERMVDDGDA